MRAAVVVGVLALASAGVFVGEAVAHKNGQWSTVASARASIVGHPLSVLWCLPAATTCLVDPSSGTIQGYRQIKVAVSKVRVVGSGPEKTVNGARRYQDFQVWLCARNYLDGGAIVGAHALWHTRRPPSTSTSTTNGLVFTQNDDGQPFAQDWRQRSVDPIVRAGCPA